MAFPHAIFSSSALECLGPRRVMTKWDCMSPKSIQQFVHIETCTVWSNCAGTKAHTNPVSVHGQDELLSVSACAHIH